MLEPNQLHDYQREAITHQLSHDDSMLWLQMGLGKEQPNSEPVITPVGWVTMGDLVTGDFVIGSDGLPTRVTGVFPQGSKEVVTMTMSDGTHTRCGWDHLWCVKTNHDVITGKEWRTLTTRELLESGLKQGDNSKYIIPLCDPVYYSEKQLVIPPYTMGAFLGDGHSSERAGAIICSDDFIVTKCDCSSVKDHETSVYTKYGYLSGIKQTLRDMNLLGKRSWEKHVPDIYMRGSITQRLQLLQGLLDTDGSPITSGGGVEFSSTSENLIDSVVELTQSLGGVARKSNPRNTTHQNGIGRTSWRVNVKLPDQFEPFTLPRKLDKWIRPSKYQPQRRIRTIKVTGKEQSTCISVAAKDKLYLTRHHIVTHNTIVSLTSTVDRMRANLVKKTLIFGPLRVVTAVWEREARKWSHTKHLTFSVVHGTPEQRLRALFRDADVYLINYEQMNWLAQTLDHYYLSQDRELPYQSVIYDEVSKLKNSTTKRMSGGKRDKWDKRGEPVTVKITGWKKMIHEFKYRSGLTGTPASNGYLDLHGQFLAVDGGERLGEYITHYKDSYFASDYSGWNYTPTKEGIKLIESKISDIVIKMDSKDYLDMPECKMVDMMVDLPKSARKAYDEIEKNMFTELDNGSELEVFSRSSVSNKCLQFCNGSPYLNSESSEYEKVHDAKLDALEEILEEAAGAPVVCSYTFKADAERIMQKFKKYKPVNLTTAKASETGNIIKRWNRGEIKLLVGHPASMGHGVDGLQDSGYLLVWFGLNWSLELYQQMNARLDRQGQLKPVSIIRILCRDTVDLAVADAIERKDDDQEGLKNAMQRYRNGEITNNLVRNFF